MERSGVGLEGYLVHGLIGLHGLHEFLYFINPCNPINPCNKNLKSQIRNLKSPQINYLPIPKSNTYV